MIQRVREWVASDRDPQEDPDGAAGRILLVLTAALIMRMGFRLWTVLEPIDPISAVGVMLLFAVGVQLLIFAATDLDMHEHGRKVALGTVFAMAIALGISLLQPQFIPPLSTDALLFVRYGSDQLLQGVNPYEVSMHGSFVLPGTPMEWATPRIDGTIASRLAYPPGAVLAHLPARALGLEIRVVAMAAAFASMAIIIRAAPPELALAGPAALIAVRNVPLTAAGGVWDPVWVVIVLVALRAAYAGRLTVGGAALGLAMAIKQHAWIIAPFVLVRQWRLGNRRESIRGATAGAAIFLAINAPFAIWNFQAWIRGTFAQVAGDAPMVPQGVGITLLTMTDTYAIPTAWHELAIAVCVIVLLLAVVLYPERIGYAPWVFAPAILWFHYRSLSSYFVWPVGVAVLAVLATQDRLDTTPVLASLRQQVAEWWDRLRRPEVAHD